MYFNTIREREVRKENTFMLVLRRSLDDNIFPFLPLLLPPSHFCPLSRFLDRPNPPRSTPP